MSEHTEQQGLFDTGAPFTPRSPEQLVRPTDPDTSHDAAEQVQPTLREYQERVLSVVREGPGTHRDFIARYRERFGDHGSDSGIRTRCSELVDAGLVVDTGERVRLKSGRFAAIWRAV